MRFRPICALAGLGLALAGALPSPAQEAGQPLPLRQVILFNSGVGYFERSGKVDGNASVPLSFRAEQVNDLLKSLVLLDPQGSVRPVTYTARDPLPKQLPGAGLAVTQNVSLGSLLRQFQGARVRLELGEPVEGRILSVSTRGVPTKEGTLQQEILNLSTDTGLRAVPLDEVKRVRLLDERLDRQLRESLELLATRLDDQRRTVELHFDGNGARDVQAGYLLEAPIWKTSYRLVLDEGAKPYLQGWAIVENTTDEDWKEIRLSLVSGRPVSFIQDLYQPLYVPRPVVQAQVVGSPTPQTYTEALDEKRDADRVAQRQEEQRKVAALQLRPARAGASGPQGLPGPPGPPGAPPASMARRMADMPINGQDKDGRFGMEMSAATLAQSVAAQAEGAERGELFQYAIKQPVSLPRQQAAMVPIVAGAIDGQSISIYDANSDVRHALNGFRLTNTTGLNLAGGPVTVFQGGAYAGDAQITHLQPNEDRLLSYAVDLDLVVDREEPKFNQQTLSVNAKSGLLRIARKQQRVWAYRFRNKSEKPKTVLIQQDEEPEFKLVEPAKPAEKSPGEYRFELAVAPGKTESLKVVTEHTLTETVALIDADLNFLQSYAQNAELSEPLRVALKQLSARREKVAELQRKRAVLEAELKAIDTEQARIRQNMAQLDRGNDLYKQYVKKLTDQETRIEAIKAEMARLREAEADAQRELRAFTEGLSA
jgi:hypothetical protein